MVKLTEGVDFINILCAPFLYKNALSSFSQITVWPSNFLANKYLCKSCLQNGDEIEYRYHPNGSVMLDSFDICKPDCPHQCFEGNFLCNGICQPYDQPCGNHCHKGKYRFFWFGFYRMCHRFRLTKRDIWDNFDHVWIERHVRGSVDNSGVARNSAWGC